MRIVQLANFWTPTSGGLRVVMDRLADGYRRRGHRVLQIVPGAHDDHQFTTWGRRTTVAAPIIPGAGGYRMILRLRHVERLVRAFEADAVEVSDRATLAHVATRSSAPPVRVVLVAHERLDNILGAGAYGGALDARLIRRASDTWNPRCWEGADEVVVPSLDAADEWHRVGIVPRIVPWGVDLDTFAPTSARRDPDGPLRLCWLGRLTREKQPDLAIEALRVLVSRGVDAELTMVGDGPLADRLHTQAGALAVDFLGHLARPAQIASRLAAADVSLSTSGIESFGLAVVESLACGTPVVACVGGAAGDVVGDAGRVVPHDPMAIAAAALQLRCVPGIRSVARARADDFRWDRAIDSMLEVLATPRRSAA